MAQREPTAAEAIYRHLKRAEVRGLLLMRFPSIEIMP